MNEEKKTKVGTAFVAVKMAFTESEIGGESADSFLAQLLLELPITIGDGIPLLVESVVCPDSVPA